VPGAKAPVEGSVGVFDNQGRLQEGVAGVKVVLVSDQLCPVTGEQTTDVKATPTSTTGAPAGSGGGESGGGLASTGVEALALVALALGGGLVIGSRRRKTAK
jgi:hypothetical protein